MTRKEIGNHAKKARLAKGLSFRKAVAFAEQNGISITEKQIGFIEKGASNYTIDTVIAYAELFGASIDWVDGKPTDKK